MDEIEDLLDAWFCAEYAVRTTSFGEGRNRQALREDANSARKALAFRLATAHEPR